MIKEDKAFSMTIKEAIESRKKAEDEITRYKEETQIDIQGGFDLKIKLTGCMIYPDFFICIKKRKENGADNEISIHLPRNQVIQIRDRLNAYLEITGSKT